MNHCDTSNGESFRARVRTWLKKQPAPFVDDHGNCRGKFRFRGIEKEFEWTKTSDDDECEETMDSIYLQLFTSWHDVQEKKKLTDAMKNRFTAIVKKKSKESASHLREKIEKNLDRFVETLMAMNKNSSSILTNLPLLNENKTTSTINVDKNRPLPSPLLLENNQKYNHLLMDVFCLDDSIVEKIILNKCTGLELLSKIAKREIAESDITSIRDFCGDDIDVEMLSSMQLYGTLENKKIIFPNPPQSAWLVSANFFSVFRNENDNVITFNPFPEERFSILIRSEEDLYALLAARALAFDHSCDYYLSSV